MISFNPFLVRASVYWAHLVDHSIRQFYLFQSLLSQGISLLPIGMTEKIWYDGKEFQSLLSQGISLLAAHGLEQPIALLDGVSIPS